MRQSMTKSSKLSKRIFSADSEKIIKEIVVRVEKFKAEADVILSKYQPVPIVKEAKDLIENLFLKFHSVAVEIARRHANRNTLRIKDEYDVQDLLHGLLRIHFEDIQDEEWTPSYAGGCCRIDFLLRNENIAIETKMTSKKLGHKKIREQLIIDKAHYRTHPLCKTLYCLVYDPHDKIKNPRGFEKDLSDKANSFETKVFVVPKRD
jgi:hypothetical protein